MSDSNKKLRTCPACGKEVSKRAKTCPHCGERLKRGFLFKAFVAVVGVFALMTLVGILAPPSEDTEARTAAVEPVEGVPAAEVEDASAAKPEVAPAEAPAVDLRPDQQRSFLASVEQGRADVRGAENDLQIGAVLTSLNEAVCALLPRNKVVTDWIGEIDELGANSDGKGILEVLVADDVLLKTSNNAFSDIGTNSLIEPGSELFIAITQLSEGDQVRFSGEFFTDDEGACGSGTCC